MSVHITRAINYDISYLVFIAGCINKINPEGTYYIVCTSSESTVLYFNTTSAIPVQVKSINDIVLCIHFDARLLMACKIWLV